jgi:alkanesulfonate monooxygenase SsuD/methylene tetrahydromethanopterin reductase-like flavin-dependent oxidoreductase (luciferase family)
MPRTFGIEKGFYHRGMPQPGVPLEKLGFLTIGLFDGDDPGPGHQATLEAIALGERLGFDSAWVRHRHLQYGISSPVAVLAAASQRTSRIELGTAVIPLGWENPLRLAEDLATVDVLSGGRLNPGVSVGPPMHFDDVRDALYPDTAGAEDFGYERVARLLRFVAGEQASSLRGTEGFEQFSDRVEPYSPGLRERMWYGGASLSSAFALPFTFEPEDYQQILTDIADKLGPALGWRPRELS